MAAFAPALINVGSAVLTAAPGVLDKTLSYVRRATRGKVTTAAQAAAFAKRGVAQASIIAQGLAQGGMPVNEILPAESARGNPELTALHTSLNQMYGQLGAAFTQTRIQAPIHQDENDDNKDIIRKELLMAVRKVFGSFDNAQRVAVALATLTPADYSWGKKMGF